MEMFFQDKAYKSGSEGAMDDSLSGENLMDATSEEDGNNDDVEEHDDNNNEEDSDKDSFLSEDEEVPMLTLCRGRTTVMLKGRDSHHVSKKKAQQKAKRYNARQKGQSQTK